MNKIKEIWQEIGQFQILENDLQNVVICLIILAFGLLLKRVISVWFSALIFRTIKKTSKDIPAVEFIDLLKSPIEFLFILILIYNAFTFIEYPNTWHLVSEKRFGLKMFINRSYGVLAFMSITWVIYRVVDFFALVIRQQSRENNNKLQEQLVPFLKQLIKLIITVIMFFIALGAVFNLNVGAIITGLGIGGVAVALAGKETLENLLASFSIFIDKPFIAGDLVKLNDIVGNVESVGFRTTKIRTLDKSLVTIPNKQLIDQPLENLSYREMHRAKFTIGLPNDTPLNKVASIIEKIKAEILKLPETCSKTPNVFFDSFGTYSLDITIIYYVSVVDFEDFWKIKEILNYQIMRVVDSEEIGLEYPTSIVHLKNEKS
jgi:MscS family membrane protein